MAKLSMINLLAKFQIQVHYKIAEHKTLRLQHVIS